MTGATLFSGIGAPEQAMPDWDWRWHAEIEPFPSAVMGVRHPQSVNLGDVSAEDFCDRAAALGRPDVLVFGSPCQSFSVAGKRLGLDDPRGNLALVALGIVARLRPTWFVFENVPGLLSSTDGRDFGLFLRAVDDIGYHLAWRVLDAQYAGVAQRRRRVFAVGHARDWRRAAAVLLEPDRLCGHPPTRGEARQDVAGTLDAGTSAGGHGRFASADSAGRNHLIPDIANVLTNRMHKGINTTCDEGQTLIAHSLRGEGFDASEDGTGRGTPLVPIAFSHFRTDLSHGSNAPTLGAHQGGGAGGCAVAYAIGSHAGAADGDQTNRSHASGGPVGLNISEEQAYSLRGGRTQAVSFVAGVRRLTPRECERLQGMSDDYTLVTYRGKPAADGPRYKAIGNSMAVPVIRWILERIEQLEQLVLDVKTEVT